ncbi:uncharacterized protein LOC127795963 [Diospyros lotus]|uniref:uncharacterized protein LOC127795963 n=1 Tax=Diospyros lotus TaxID=55363 RepID=UPI002255AB78|nr:uncharacterized protein LOC127795963 [Diospyros lotus]
MIHLLCKRLQPRSSTASISVHGILFSTSSVNQSLDGLNSSDRQSVIISYLLNSCGLSVESAISVSKRLRFETTEQPDSVLNLLRSHGLNQAHIRNLVANRPMILVADANKTLKPNFDLLGSLGFSGTNLVKVLNKDPRILETDVHASLEFLKAYGFTEQQVSMITMKHPSLFLYDPINIIKPKLEYLESMGLSREEVAQILSSEPYILRRSLENHIIPCVQVIRRLVGSNDNVLKVIKSCYQILDFNLEMVIEQNIKVLMNHGVPELNALKLIMIQPRSLLSRNKKFVGIVKEVEKMGFNPRNMTFLYAVRSLSTVGKSLWKQKLETYRSFGLSEDEILLAFKLQPMCMLISDKKIKKMMEFFVKELKLQPSLISKNPCLLQLSLEKRIIPRCSVVQLLASKHIIERCVGLVNALRMTEKLFLEMYVRKFQDLVPEVVEAHQGKVQFQGFTVKLKELTM